MTKSLKMRGYRAFEHFEIDDLARVNLLVGKNGCGKTSILEAIQILETQGFVGTLRDIANQRGETTTKEQQDRSRPIFLPNIAHLFHGRRFAVGVSFEIVGDGKNDKVRAQVRDVSSLDARLDLDFFHDIPIDGSLDVLDISGKQFPVFDDGALFLERPSYLRQPDDATKRPVPVQFVGADSLNLEQMSAIWNHILIDSKEDEVIDAMRILDPSIEGVFFLSDYPSRRGRGRVLVSFNDGRGRLPLGSTGEGMRRLLALALALAQAKGGVLLVDEIDTGLHYSVLGQMWLLIVEAARKMDIQVFATTHSLDCVKGLAWLCENHLELRDEVALHKIDAGLDHSVAFDAEQIAIADEQGIEVR